MSRKARFYNDMLGLECIIYANVVEERKNGPIVIALYKRLCSVFNHNPILY